MMMTIIIIIYEYNTDTSGLYKEMWSAHNRQTMNTYTMYIDRTSKLVPI
jgi:hypothetical protein